MPRFEKVPNLKKETHGRGRVRTKSLFIEYAFQKNDRTEEPIYTLAPHDRDEYVSLKRLYLQAEDLTEYEFATEYMPEGYPQWEALASSQGLKEIIQGWRKELDLKIKARELRRLMDIAEEGGKDSIQASKFLLAKGYADKNTKGRPSKDEIKQEATRLAQHEFSIDEEYDRIINKGTN